MTVDDDNGRYVDNDALTVGGKYLFGDLSSIGAEVTTGDRGDSAQLNGEYRISPEHTFYGAYTYSTDRSDYDPLFNDRQNSGWTLGQRWRLSNQVNLFNESQFIKAPNESGLAHTFGMDFYPGVGWTLGFTLQQANLDRAAGNVERDAVSISAGRTSNDTQWQSKLEFRQDTGAERRDQWVTTNQFTQKISESLRIAARFNYSKTTDELQATAGAKFIEATSVSRGARSIPPAGRCWASSRICTTCPRWRRSATTSRCTTSAAACCRWKASTRPAPTGSSPAS